MRLVLMGRGLRLAALLGVAIGSVVACYYVARYVEMLILFSSIVGSHNVVETSVKNGQGDEVAALTEASGRWQDPDKTVIRLRRFHHWFSTTLLETESFGVRKNFNWKDGDTLDIALDFGCLTQMTRPVETVGSIHIFYHFRDGDKALATGCPD